MNPQKPRPVKLLCVAFLVWSALSIAVNLPRWSAVSPSGATAYPIDLGAFGFVAAIGLWRLSPAGRTFALVLTWYWLCGAVLLFFRVFPLPFLRVTPGSDFLAAVPLIVLQIFVVPFFLAQLWQLRTLRRPDIQALFRHPSPASRA